jgi:hypothetical protein
MDRWRLGEDRGSKEMDGCPLTLSTYVPLTASSEYIPPLSAYVLVTASSEHTLPPSAYLPSTAASDRYLHLVNPFRMWTYCLMVLFPQSVMDNQMETY